MVMCPECESDLEIEEHEVYEGEVYSCPECGRRFEVASVDPLRMEMFGQDDTEEAEK
jgi:lysine biosynthesis protein LysW